MRSSGPALLLSALVGGAACHGATTMGDGVASSEEATDTMEVEDGSSGEPPVADACTDACVDLDDEAGLASCHSCRCKAAFDDWLPSAEEFQCSNGVPIVTYHAQLSDTDFELVPAGPSSLDCANPSLLTSSCRQGSTLGHLTHGDVSMYWICRDPYLDLDGSVLYEDVAAIGHNTRTGATCFWDDVNDVIHEDDAPPLDLAEATDDERTRYLDAFAYTDGTGCVACHDHDPFVYTPFLQSTGWQSVAASKGPYHLVDLDGGARPTGVMHLVSAPASPCTTCHRLGSANTCSFFAPDSLASHKISAYEPEVHAAMEPGSPHWALAYWMPSQAQPVAALDDWQAAFAEAREHILGCCEAPGAEADGCEWAPVPAQ